MADEEDQRQLLDWIFYKARWKTVVARDPDGNRIADKERRRYTHTHKHVYNALKWIHCVYYTKAHDTRRCWRLNRIRFTSHAYKNIVYIYKGKNRLDYGELPIRSSLHRLTNPQPTDVQPLPVSTDESTFRWLDDDCRPSSSYHSFAAHLFTSWFWRSIYILLLLLLSYQSPQTPTTTVKSKVLNYYMLYVPV